LFFQDKEINGEMGGRRILIIYLLPGRNPNEGKDSFEVSEEKAKEIVRE
jgi:hypothetical protein